MWRVRIKDIIEVKGGELMGKREKYLHERKQVSAHKQRKSVERKNKKEKKKRVGETQKERGKQIKVTPKKQ